MSIKLISIVVITFFILSCGSSKQVARTASSEDTLQNQEQSSSLEVKHTEPVEKPTKKESTQTAPKVEIEKERIQPEKPEDAFNHDVWNRLLQKHVSEQGKVNYKGFKTDKTEFYGYLNSLSKTPPEDTWSKNETLAYWINVYNAFTIKLILDNYPTKSIKDLKDPWNHRFIKIGNKWYTLNDIEHRIIRKMDEPRIHFALVCAAVSCPRLYNKAFTAKDLETDLDVLTRGFLSDSTKNEISENDIKLSKIFKWYGGDFKTSETSLIDFINQYTDVRISDKAHKSYKDYNWDLNE
jgi:hypothetical protein